MSTAAEPMEIDENLYSRQLYVLGHEAMKRMAASNILLVGLKGLGVEIAKNIILGGVKSVTLLDNEPVQMSDLGSQFYLNESKVGQPRAAACVAELIDLNRNVRVDLLNDNQIDDALLCSGRFQLVVLTECSTSEQLRVNELCRKHRIGFISADVRGLMAGCFVDLGDLFVCSDATGEAPITKLIASITQDENGMVTLLDESRHGLQTGDYVEFEEVEGMTELNQLSQPLRIKETGPFTFTIGDTRGFHAYERGGRFRQVKQSVEVSFQSLSQQIVKPSLCDAADQGKFNHPAQLHCMFQALSEFQSKFGRLPLPHTMDDAAEVVRMATAIGARDQVEINAAAMLPLARCASAQIAPMTACLGGIVAQECMKAVSGKFMPIKQFLYMDMLEALPSDVPLASFAPQQCRYDDYIAVFGADIQAKMCQQRFFLVGAGAIGCEMLKNFAMMGVGSQGGITVTDMDTIEKSNLSRQFLFRNSHVGQLKSMTAAQQVMLMNPQLSGRVHARADRVAPETQDIYDDSFWSNLDGVCTALDNVQARLYVDQRCVHYAKPLLESGTLGTKGNTQVVVPFVTESYGSTRDPPEQSIPICTLKNFPYQIEHTIQWAREQFEGYFKTAPTEVNGYLTDANYLTELAKQPNTQTETLKGLHASLVGERPLTFDQCIQWARLKFEEEYHQKIAQLLFNYPVDSLNSEGGRFWSGTKRAPAPLQFDSTDATHMMFVVAAARLRAHLYGLQSHGDVQAYQAVLNAMHVEPYVPRGGVKIATTEADAKQPAAIENMTDLQTEVKALVSVLPSPASLAGYRVHPVEFEKDDDTNFHMEFVTACSNLRARNYRIKEESKHNTKQIAGKIIPAIATTTALVAGLIALELYKIVQKKPIESYRCAFANLALPLFSFSEPFAPAFKTSIVKGGELKYSLWDRLDIEGVNMTLQQLIAHIEQSYGLSVSMMSYGAAIIYSFFGNKAEAKIRMAMPLGAVCERVSKTTLPAHTKFLHLDVCCSDENDVDVDLPPLRIRIA